jgi:hypothetical protein
MRAGRLTIPGFLVLAVALVGGGCEQLNPYRQGWQSTYNKELQELAEKVSREEPAKTTTGREDNAPVAAAQTKEGVVQANHSDAPSLLSGIHMRPPEPIDYSAE